MFRVLARRCYSGSVASVGTLIRGASEFGTLASRELHINGFRPSVYSAWTQTSCKLTLPGENSLWGHLQPRSFASQPEPAPVQEPVPDFALFNAQGDGKTYDSGYVQAHPGIRNEKGQEASYLLMHPVYTKEYAESVKPTHKPPKKVHEWVGYLGVQFMRRSFDLLTGYGKDMTEEKWLFRMLFLETVAGVPGMVGAMLRHLKSLRTMQRDHGWIHTLLEEAENERMHLLTFLQMRKPGLLFRGAVLMTQGIFFNGYMLFYILWPRMCHAFVGYLEEEAVKTYSKVIEDLDEGKLPKWQTAQVPEIAKGYWHLEPNATMRDMLLAVRADEASHKHVNHTFSEMKQVDTNPFSVGSMHVP